MDLKMIKGIGPSKQDKLKLAGITNVDTLARADVFAVAEKSGLPAEQVKELKQKAVGLVLVEDLKGVGPATLGTLSQAGAASLRELYDAGADWLTAEIKVAQHRLDALKHQAEELALHVATEAQTPQGRKVLVGEARDAALDAAKQAEKAGRQAVAAAKKAGDKAVVAARDVQTRAPELLAQAEATLKDARAKATEAAKKAEAQKAKANTERVVVQARQRFNKAA